MTKLNKEAAFYDWLRNDPMMGPTIDAEEFEGLKAITDACGTANWPLAYTAYALATAYHETAHSMQPVPEYGGNKYFTRMYDITGERPTLAKKNGNTNPGDGPKYKGRGYVQLTWKNNYIKAGSKIGLPNLWQEPDLALRDDVAAKIMIGGMSEGWFTGKACKNYLPSSGAASKEQFIQARRIINGVDKADQIAGYALKFQKALQAGNWA